MEKLNKDELETLQEVLNEEIIGYLIDRIFKRKYVYSNFTIYNGKVEFKISIQFR